MTKGLDLSQHQKGINISSVKSAGNEFVILRGGYTGYGSGRTKQKDTCFESFYAQAKSADLPVGVYWYSCADSAAFGKSEAEFLYNNCLKGKQFEYPIYIDVEEERWQAKNRKGVTDAIVAFCEYLENLGYYVGIYASLDWFANKIDTKRLDAYSKWVAAWRSSKPIFSYPGFELWQNSDSGKCAGYKVDTNVAYVDFPKIIKGAGLNGFKKSASIPVVKKPAEKKKTVDELAKEVIAGKWGNGEDRKKALEKAGYDYAAVQKRVNELIAKNEKPSTYTVKKGDTLTAIAKQFGTTVNKLKELNKLARADMIKVGQKLKIG